jgi:hypothetical protein
MKHLILFILFLYLSGNSFSQFQKVEATKYVSIGKWKNGGRLSHELSYSVDDNNDTTYRLLYTNESYSQIIDLKAIRFSEEGSTLDSLYSTLKECFSREKDYQISFKLGEELVTVKVDKMMGMKYIIVLSSQGYFTLTKNGLEKLFGKK